MISICPDCKFYCDRACAINPNYCDAFKLLQGSTKRTQELLSPVMEPCPYWEESSDLQLVEASKKIKLSIRAWRKIAYSNNQKFKELVEEAKNIVKDYPIENGK